MLLYPELKKQLGQNTIAADAGDYKWHDSMTTQLTDAINTEVGAWVGDDPPFGYDTKVDAHMELWQVRRRAGLLWAKSIKVIGFCKYVYQTYSTIFSTVIENQYRHTLQYDSIAGHLEPWNQPFRTSLIHMPYSMMSLMT